MKLCFEYRNKINLDDNYVLLCIGTVSSASVCVDGPAQPMENLPIIYFSQGVNIFILIIKYSQFKLSFYPSWTNENNFICLTISDALLITSIHPLC